MPRLVSAATSPVRARQALLIALIAIAFTIGAMAAMAPRAHAIVGGQPASEDYPNMAAFLDDGNQICGASLIAPQWVISAAHCVSSLDASNYSFRIGGARDLNEAGGETIQATKVIVHPQYDDVFDVSLFQLERPSVYEPIRLADPSADRDLWEPGDMARVIGYGGQFFQMPALDGQLNEVDVPVVSDADCDASYDLMYGGIDERVEVCAGEEEGLKDSCQGDSGGPLMVRDEAGEWVQMGVVSWGFGCGFPTQYGVYSRVGDSLLYDWVMQTINNTEPPPPPPPPPPGGETETVTVGEQGYIAGSMPLGDAFGVTGNELALTCMVPLTQSVDGYVWELPSELAVPGAVAKVTGDAIFYDLDIAFYGVVGGECTYLGGSGSTEVDESAEIPEGTQFVLAHNWFGADTLVDLTVDVPVSDTVTETSLAITSDGTEARFGDQTTFSARLTDTAGAALSGKAIRFALLDADGDTVQIVPGSATDADGVSTATAFVAVPAGDYTLEAIFLGEPDVLTDARATTAFTALPGESALALAVEGVGNARSVTGTLTDADAGIALAGRSVEFFADCRSIGTADTGEDGAATVQVPARYRAVTTQFSAVFEGDTGPERYYAGSDSGPDC